MISKESLLAVDLLDAFLELLVDGVRVDVIPFRSCPGPDWFEEASLDVKGDDINPFGHDEPLILAWLCLAV